ncbi:hypothetical protein ASPWEDRAFT_42701 [Aspergillus wentii DTO 134E9]|uniref:Uncharacterized protein n=1 Tax=Aspergillus wentii DTO 134E9 TaxID=1073089 RepID=A0A1L9RCQ3_ASPWE|nr:uncharacterized protein ASPWEDRAFT_42701 [Aspergillus wentii DTO 134E9]OJJ32691.1 hypothetical protein ASPWEDRAFT_42701 [Aspergillus wentii DTO 134E9]
MAMPSVWKKELKFKVATGCGSDLESSLLSKNFDYFCKIIGDGLFNYRICILLWCLNERQWR